MRKCPPLAPRQLAAEQSLFFTGALPPGDGLLAMGGKTPYPAHAQPEAAQKGATRREMMSGESGGSRFAQLRVRGSGGRDLAKLNEADGGVREPVAFLASLIVGEHDGCRRERTSRWTNSDRSADSSGSAPDHGAASTPSLLLASARSRAMAWSNAIGERTAPTGDHESRPSARTRHPRCRGLVDSERVPRGVPDGPRVRRGNPDLPASCFDCVGFASPIHLALGQAHPAEWISRHSHERSEDSL